MPPCRRPKGCEHEAILSDVQVEHVAIGWLAARQLYQVNQMERLYIDRLEDLDLKGDSRLLQSLEVVFAESMAIKARRREAQNRARRK